MTHTASKQYARLPRKDQERVLEAMRGLATDPRPPGCEKMRDGSGWRIRQGDYRIVYRVDDAARLVTVVRVAHRRDAYR